MLRQKNMVEAYRCGAEFLPSPMASKAEFALEATPLLTRTSHLTAVAVAVEMGHAVAFLGTASGEVRPFFLPLLMRFPFAVVDFLLLFHLLDPAKVDCCSNT